MKYLANTLIGITAFAGLCFATWYAVKWDSREHGANALFYERQWSVETDPPGGEVYHVCDGYKTVAEKSCHVPVPWDWLTEGSREPDGIFWLKACWSDGTESEPVQLRVNCGTDYGPDNSRDHIVLKKKGK
jgi:hypothetical protein